MHRLRIVLCLLLLAATAVTAGLLVPHSPAALQELVAGAGPLGVAGFLLGGALLTVAMFPGTVLAATGGLLFGPVAGAALVLVAQTLGGVCAAAAARSGARSSMERMAGKRLRKLSAHSAATGVLGIATVRSAPGMPAAALHYVLGVSRAPMRAIALGLAIGAAPRIAAYALLGGGLSDLHSGAAVAGAALLVATTAVTAALALRLRRRQVSDSV